MFFQQILGAFKNVCLNLNEVISVIIAWKSTWDVSKFKLNIAECTVTYLLRVMAVFSESKWNCCTVNEIVSKCDLQYTCKVHTINILLMKENFSSPSAEGWNLPVTNHFEERK